MRLNYHQKSNGMYILKKPDFEDIATQVLAEYAPQNLFMAQPLDADHFLKECLYLDVKYRYLSISGSILGMIAFEDIELPRVVDGCKMEAIKEGTILIDPSLCTTKQNARCRFTKIHEGSHWILHRSYHSPTHKCYNFRKDMSIIACRSNTIERFRWKRDRKWNDEDWEEWQADSLTAALLMPREVFLDAVDYAMRRNRIFQRYLIKGEQPFESRRVIQEIATLFGVSQRATQIRMNQFNMIRETWG